MLDGFKRAKTGQGQAFSILSEAGVGKSRLLYEFRKAVANENVIFMEGKCLSYSRGVAYHPIIDIVKSTFDIFGSDKEFEIREKLKKGLKLLDIDDSWILPYLLELLSVKDSGVESFTTSPESKKDRILEAVNHITIRASHIRPLIIAIEDLHWIDKSSEDSLKSMLENITGEKIFLILTYRPDYIQTWSTKSYHSQINLNRLYRRESVIIAAHLLGAKKIERDLEKLVLEKTEGVPFFIEEFIKTLKDLEIIKRKNDTFHLTKNINKVTIPSTIQDVIMTRVDALPDRTKKVLQISSAIEREFDYEILKLVTKYDEQDLLSDLSILTDSELLYERGIHPKSTFIFKHALIREVVYDSILSDRKKKFHEKIGKSIELLCNANIEEHYGVLVKHFFESNNYEKVFGYSILAAKLAEKKAAFIDAIPFAKKCVASLEKLPYTDIVEKRIIDSRTTLGLYCMTLNYFIEAKQAVEPIVNKAIKRDYKERLSQIFTILGVYSYAVEENIDSAFNYLNDALNISEKLNDILSLVMATYWSGLGLALAICEFDEALQRIQKVLKINVEAKLLWGISMMKSNISTFINNFQGKISHSYQNSTEALQIAEESGDVLPKAIAYTSYGTSCYYKGLLINAEEILLKGVGFCERLNLFLWSALTYGYLGEVYYDIGDYQKSQEYFLKSNSYLENGSYMPSWVRKNKLCISRAKAIGNEKNIDMQFLHSQVNENKFKIYDGWIPRNIAEILINIGGQHTCTAEDWINKAIKMDKNNGMMWYLARDYVLYSEFFKQKGDHQSTKDSLFKAIEIFKECGADGWVVKFEKELAKL